VNRKAILALLLVSVILCSTGVVSAQPAPTEKYIAFRDDDVQPFASVDTLKAVNQVHIDENVPVTLGIIPHPYPGGTGNELLMDNQFLVYMRSIAANPLFEFAQHGHTHINDQLLPQASEFAGRPYAQQLELMQNGKADIKEAFGVTPNTFIPPFDKGDNNTLKAAAALGFTDYSSSFGDFHTQQSYEDGVTIEAASVWIGATSVSPSKLSITAFSASIQAAKNATEQYMNNPQSGDMFIVAYHVWAFDSANGTVDARKIELFRNYIDWLKTLPGAQFERLDRSQWGGSNALVALSSAVGLSVLSIRQSRLLVFVLVGSVVIVLFSTYAIALRRRLRRSGRRD